MTTQTHASSARQTPPAARLRRAVAVGAMAPLLALAACSGDEPITAQGRSATTQASTSTAEASSTAEPATPTETPAATPTSQAPTETSLKTQFKDPELGHIVKPLRLVRNVPWPTGNPVAEESYEIIAVEVELTGGPRYSAELAPTMLTLQTERERSVPTTTEFGKLKGAPLATAARGETTKGWIYFKVPRGTSSKLVLVMHRPAYKVSTTGRTFPAKVFRAALSG